MKKKLLSWLLVAVLAFSLAPAASAKSIPTKQTDDVNKTWKVKFTQQIDAKSLHANSVFVMNGTKKIETTLRVLDNGYAVEVIPKSPYLPGIPYRLEVTQLVKGTNGLALKSKTTMPFEIVLSKEPIQSIRHSAGEGLDNFVIIGRSDVHKITINSIEMRLTGWNEFSHTFLDLKPGTDVVIRAYSNTNKLLETKNFSIPK